MGRVSLMTLKLFIISQVEWKHSGLKPPTMAWWSLDSQSVELVTVLGRVFQTWLKTSQHCQLPKEITQLWPNSPLTTWRSFISSNRKEPSLMVCSSIWTMLIRLAKFSANSAQLNNSQMSSTWLKFLSKCHCTSTRPPMKSSAPAKLLTRRRPTASSPSICLRCQLPIWSSSLFLWLHPRLTNSSAPSSKDISTVSSLSLHFHTLLNSDLLDMNAVTLRKEHLISLRMRLRFCSRDLDHKLFLLLKISLVFLTTASCQLLAIAMVTSTKHNWNGLRIPNWTKPKTPFQLDIKNSSFQSSKASSDH